MLNISKLKLNNINISNNIIKKKGELNNNIIYHPNSTKEWLNSIYNYYKKNEKNIPALDALIIKIIKNYFNMYSSRLEKSIFLRKKSVKRRRYRLNRIFISKPELKHTNDKVKIILYIYNSELSFLNLKINNLKKRILAQYFYKIFITKYITSNKLNLIKSLIKRVYLIKSYIKDLKITRNKYLSKFYIVDNNLLIANKTISKYFQQWSYLKYLSSYMRRKRLLRIGYTLNNFQKNSQKIRKFFIKNLYKGLNKKLKKNMLLYKYIQVKYLNKSIRIVKFLSILFNKLENNTYKNTINLYNQQVKNMPIFSISKKIFVNKLTRIIFKLKLLFRYNRIIIFNKSKFNIFLTPLKLFLEMIYKKNVEFDIVSIKKYHFNSSILTQVLATKSKNRKVRVLRIIEKVCSKIKLPISRKYDYLRKKSINKFRQNIILREYLNKNFIYNKPLNVNSLNKNINIKLNKLSYGIYKGDKLSLLLNSIYPIKNTLIKENVLKVFKDININNKEISNKFIIERNLENIVLDSINNKSITGIKIEASGRLSKRATAGRSTSVIKQKGTLKNINSSYKELSSLLLRGNLSSNLQFNTASNKTRIGSFGLKGWINSI